MVPPVKRSGGHKSQAPLAGGGSQVTSPSSTNKMLLPRPTEGWPVSMNVTKRTPHACERCRALKMKCTIAQSQVVSSSSLGRCAKCVADNQICVFGDRKREKTKKTIIEAQQRNQELMEDNGKMADAIRSLLAESQFGESVGQSVIDLLSKYPADRQAFEESQHRGRTANELYSETSVHPPGEYFALFRVGSPRASDELSSVVELGTGSGAAGFVGKASEVSWIQRAREILFRQSVGEVEISQRDFDQHLLRAQDLNYHMDDFELLSVDETNMSQFSFPPLAVAVDLASAYFESLHGTFPFLDKERFMHALTRFSLNKPSYSEPTRHWLSIANLVFGLGSKWLHLTEEYGRFAADDHLSYYARARALGLDHRTLFDHPTIEQVQAMGVLALTHFTNHSLNRSWTILGHAMRHALALGLHLRVTAGSVSSHQKSDRARTWYALYSLEITITEASGRPCSVALSDISVQIEDAQSGYGLESTRETVHLRGDSGESYAPRPFSLVEQDLPAIQFPHRIRLSILSQRICSSLYIAGRAPTWSELQDATRNFDVELQEWLTNLPEELSMTQQESFDRSSDSRLDLSLLYWSVRMTLYRPCLCDLTGCIENESQESRIFNRNAAAFCVDAAISLLALLPEQPHSHETYRILPWWNLLHYVCQASAVLVLELCLGAQHCYARLHEMVTTLRKALVYLRFLAEKSTSAYKACLIFRRLLADAASRFGIDTSEVSDALPRPLRWTDAHQESLYQALENVGN